MLSEFFLRADAGGGGLIQPATSRSPRIPVYNSPLALGLMHASLNPIRHKEEASKYLPPAKGTVGSLK